MKNLYMFLALSAGCLLLLGGVGAADAPTKPNALETNQCTPAVGEDLRGDADWMAPELLDNAQLSNIDFLSSMAGWLTQREALINIAPRKTNARAVIMSDADLQNLLFRVVVLLPLAALIAGFGVWWSRRS